MNVDVLISCVTHLTLILISSPSTKVNKCKFESLLFTIYLVRSHWGKAVYTTYNTVMLRYKFIIRLVREYHENNYRYLHHAPSLVRSLCINGTGIDRSCCVSRKLGRSNSFRYWPICSFVSQFLQEKFFRRITLKRDKQLAFLA